MVLARCARGVVAWSLGLALAAHGGVDAPSSGARAAAPTEAADAGITPGQFFDWAQALFPTLFPAGPRDQSVVVGGVAYT